jgi:hypothetical protein
MSQTATRSTIRHLGFDPQGSAREAASQLSTLGTSVSWVKNNDTVVVYTSDPTTPHGSNPDYEPTTHGRGFCLSTKYNNRLGIGYSLLPDLLEEYAQVPEGVEGKEEACRLTATTRIPTTYQDGQSGLSLCYQAESESEPTVVACRVTADGYFEPEVAEGDGDATGGQRYHLPAKFEASASGSKPQAEVLAK